MHLNNSPVSAALLCLLYLLRTSHADDSNHGCPGPIIQPSDGAEYCCVGGTLGGFTIDMGGDVTTTASTSSQTATCATTIHITDSEYSSKASAASAWVATATSGAIYPSLVSASTSATPAAASGGAVRSAYDAGLRIAGLFGAVAVLL